MNYLHLPPLWCGQRPCTYPGPGSFYILLLVTRRMVSLKSVRPPGCSVSSSGWPSAHFLQVHVSVLKLLVLPTHPGLVASPISLCSLHILNSHIDISSESTPGSLQSPHQSTVMFLAIPPAPGNNFPPLQRQTHVDPLLPPPSTLSLLCSTVLRGARKCIWGSFACSAKLSECLLCIRPDFLPSGFIT